MSPFPAHTNKLVGLRQYDESIHWVYMVTRLGAIVEIRWGTVPISDANREAAMASLCSQFDLDVTGIVCLLPPPFSQQWVLEGPAFDASSMFDSWIDQRVQERWPTGVPPEAVTLHVRVLHADSERTCVDVTLVSNEAVARLHAECYAHDLRLLAVVVESDAAVLSEILPLLLPDRPDTCIAIVAPEETRVLAFRAAHLTALSATVDVDSGAGPCSDPVVSIGYDSEADASIPAPFEDAFRRAFRTRPRASLPPATHAVLLFHVIAIAAGSQESTNCLAPSAIERTRTHIARNNAFRTVRRTGLVLCALLILATGAHRAFLWKLERSLPKLHRSLADINARDQQMRTVVALRDSIRAFEQLRTERSDAAGVLSWLAEEAPPSLVVRRLQFVNERDMGIALSLWGTCAAPADVTLLLQRAEDAPFTLPGTTAYRITAGDGNRPTYSFELQAKLHNTTYSHR